MQLWLRILLVISVIQSNAIGNSDIIITFNSSSYELKWATAKQICKNMSSTKDELIRTMLSSKSAEIRELGVITLDYQAKSDAIELLHNMVKDSDCNVSRSAILALVKYNLSKTEEKNIIMKCESDILEIREACSFYFSNHPSINSVDMLITFLSDNSSKVRENAALALSQIRDPILKEPLRKALADDDVNVRIAATSYFSIIKDVDAFRLIINNLSTDNNDLLFWSIKAIGTMEISEGAVKISMFLNHKDQRIRRETALALGKCNNYKMIPILKKAMNKKILGIKQECQWAIEALSDNGKENDNRGQSPISE